MAEFSDAKKNNKIVDIMLLYLETDRKYISGRKIEIKQNNKIMGIIYIALLLYFDTHWKCISGNKIEKHND